MTPQTGQILPNGALALLPYSTPYPPCDFCTRTVAIFKVDVGRANYSPAHAPRTPYKAAYFVKAITPAFLASAQFPTNSLQWANLCSSHFMDYFEPLPALRMAGQYVTQASAESLLGVGRGQKLIHTSYSRSTPPSN